MTRSARFASWILVAGSIGYLACTQQQIRAAETVADVALAGASAACVRIHDQDADAGAVIAVVCRDESELRAALGDGGFLAINPSVAVKTVNAVIASPLAGDAGTGGQ